MSKIKRISQRSRILYNRYGIRGFCSAITNKLKCMSLPMIYNNSLLLRLHHPKLQIAFLELTNKCNLHCKMCKWQSREKTGYMSESLFKKCINEFSQLRLEVLNLQFGGESILHPDFKNFLEYAILHRGSGKIGSIGLTDNGMLFNESIADLFVSLKVDWINFSLDGVGQVNDNIRLGSKYSIIERNIKYLLKKRGGAKRPNVLLNMVDYEKTEREKLQFFNEWVFQVDSIELIPAILPNNTWKTKDTLSPNIKIAPSPAFCTSPLNTIIIGWDGKVAGCCFDSNFDMPLGDASKDSIKHIWNGNKYQNLRKAVITNTFNVGSPCFGCEFWKINFEPGYVPILNGKAQIEYSGNIRKIRKARKI